ncbi:ModB, partial [Erwinia sp. B116]
MMSVLPSLLRGAAARPTSRWPGSERWVLWLLALAIGLLSIAPLARLIWAAIAPAGVPDSERLLQLLATPRVLRATGNTLIIALASTGLALLLGTLAAWLVALSDMRAKAAWVFA